ncbi:caffeoylshikimate esterase [Dorcoceras hygrometricum]|uniref:Caffeoylshikimate esterase n=1 Tax=Dorcoceras hygrometricum TaxID=472368 RepID=A0A2Z7CWU9_9LAMI|nr:caffeoylshikimate esterase [Dorcoceras hygrometricum]
MLRRRDHLLVFVFVLPAPATNDRALPDEPIPAMLHALRDHLLVLAIVLPDPDTMMEPFRLDHPQIQMVLTRPATAPTVVARERTTLEKATHRAAAEHTAEGVLHAATGSTLNITLRTTTNHPYDPMNSLRSSHNPSSSPSTEAMQESSKNREMHMKQYVIMDMDAKI